MKSSILSDAMPCSLSEI